MPRLFGLLDRLRDERASVCQMGQRCIEDADPTPRENSHGRCHHRTRPACPRRCHLDWWGNDGDHLGAAGGAPWKPRHRPAHGIPRHRTPFRVDRHGRPSSSSANRILHVARLELWERFHSAQFWWMHAMVCVWLLFVLMLFVIEPFILHRHFHKWATVAPEPAFAWLQRAHWVLLVLSLVTIFGAVTGSQGWSAF